MTDFKDYDLTVQTWLQGVIDSRGADAEATNQYCDKLIAYGKEQQDDWIRGFAYYYKAENCYVLNDTEDFFKNIMTALSYLDVSHQWELMARAYNIMAITSMNRGNAPFAMDYYLNALAYCDKYQLDDVGTMIKINIGVLYHSCGNDIQAQNYFEMNLPILQGSDLPHRIQMLFSVYLGIANTQLGRGLLDKADEYMEKAKNLSLKLADPLFDMCLHCFQARLYHAEGKGNFRDEAIAKVANLSDIEIPLLDMFDDLYDYTKMLLEAGKEEDFWKILMHLEELSKQAKITYLQKKILSLKIKFYKRKEDHAGYLQASGLYYELSEMMERENEYMIGKMLDVRGFLEESTKQKKQMEIENQELHHKSETDALTGLANRFRLNQYADKKFEEAIADHTPVAIEIMDIDYFKQYNDNYGHQAGDTCIYKVGRALKQMMEHDNVFVARYGGDEFVAIYTGYTKDAVEGLMEELKKRIVGLNIEHRYSKAAEIVTVSQGASYGIPNKGDRVWDFLHSADEMLYKVKTMSRNSVFISDYEGE